MSCTSNHRRTQNTELITFRFALVLISGAAKPVRLTFPRVLGGLVIHADCAPVLELAD